jgi:arogenate dehydrogenase (NADP+)
MMAQYNRQALLSALKTYQEQLALITQAIETENWKTLEALLVQTQQARTHFNGV